MKSMCVTSSYRALSRAGLCALAVTLCWGAAVFGQDKQSAEQSYAPDYFTVFQPQSARDMVRRIPGFTVTGSGGGERGFGQASGNVLIDGRRPSSKTSGAEEILGRISVDKVVRIDILDGASLDIPGLSGQVANVITGGSGISGNWEYAMRFEEGTEPQLLDGEISVSGARGNLAYIARFNSGQFTFTEDGTEQFFAGDGTLFEDRRERIYFEETRPGTDINLTYTPDNGHVANLNMALTYSNQNLRFIEDFTARSPRGNTGGSDSRSGDDALEYEIGGDYARPFLSGTLKLIALHSLESEKSSDVFTQQIGDQGSFTETFARDTDEGEYIARTEYSFKTGETQDWQLSAEGAFNFLDQDTALFDDLTTPELGRTRVEEKRAEGNITHGWAVSPRISIQSSLGVEYSQLNVTTLAEPARSFVRPKGFISASFAKSPRYSWRARIERDVGQLNFGTFVDGVNLTDDILTAGNSQIVPTQFWTAEVELDRIDAKAVSGTVRAFARFIEDPVDRIRFDNGTEGPGNLDSALEYGVEGNLTWVMDGIGLTGMRLEMEGGLTDSEIDDPLTGSSRRINDTDLWFYEIDYRWDIPGSPYAIGAEIEHDRESPFLRLDQTFDGRIDSPFVTAFVTHKTLLGMQVSVVAQNILDNTIVRDREIFAPDRLGTLLQAERFDRQRGRRISLTLSDTF